MATAKENTVIAKADELHKIVKKSGFITNSAKQTFVSSTLIAQPWIKSLARKPMALGGC